MSIIVRTAYETAEKYPLVEAAARRNGGTSNGMVEVSLEDGIGMARQFVTDVSFEAKANADAFIANAINGVQYSRA